MEDCAQEQEMWIYLLYHSLSASVLLNEVLQFKYNNSIFFSSISTDQFSETLGTLQQEKIALDKKKKN